MGENLDKHPIKNQAKRRLTEEHGRTIGVILLDGNRIIGTLEESRPNILVVRDWQTNTLKDIHRAIIKSFMLIVRGGCNGTADKSGTGKQKKD